MTPFELETHFTTKVQQLPNDISILGAIVIVSTRENARIVRIGEVDAMSAIFQTLTGIFMEKGFTEEDAGEALKRGLINTMRSHKERTAKEKR